MNTSSKANRGDATLVTVDDVRRAVIAVLEQQGAPPAAAELQAAMLLEGELRGHASHGIRRLAVLVERIRRGLIDPAAVPEATWVAPAVLRVDGRHGLGPVAAHCAIEKVTERAAETGVAMATISRSSHIGMLAPYVEEIARRGFIAVLLTTSEALVHAWGGKGAIVGTNPIGIAVPSNHEPLVLDMSTASVSMGKVLDYAATGRALPAGWAVDAAGHPTTDAAAAVDGGAISPFGGPKGYALGIALEALVGTVTATAFGTDVTGTLDVQFPSTKGDVLICISLERLGLSGMLPILDSYLDEVRSSAATDGRVDVPGDRARRTRENRLNDGLAVDSAVWTTILATLEGTTP